MVLGIIGKVGSGKTACTEYLENEYSAIVLSCDEIAKEIIESNETDYIPLPPFIFFRSEEAQEECRHKIHKIVFDRIFGYINNFKNGNAKQLLAYSRNLRAENNKNNLREQNSLIVIECALPSDRLFEMCDKVIYIKNSYEDKVKLLKEKRDYDGETTKLIYDSQSFYDKYYDKADKIIINDGTKKDLERKLKEVMDEIHIVRK